MYKKKTLRRLPTITRRYARIINDLDSVIRRLKNLTEDIDRLEMDSRALFKRREHDDRVTIDEATEILFGEEEDHEL
jgi:hypothetical protein